VSDLIPKTTETGLLELTHLIEACGTDPRKLAGLALLLVLAGLGLTVSHSNDGSEETAAAYDQVRDFARVVRELEARVKGGPH
jgi:hypothetical protein